MDDATPNEKYIEFREYSNKDEDAPTVTKLVRPTTVFINITKTQLMTFTRTWKYHWAFNHVRNIVAECVHATNKNHTGWLDINHKCYNYRMEALKYMIIVKIYSRTRYKNRAEKRSNTSKNEKYFKQIKNNIIIINNSTQRRRSFYIFNCAQRRRFY